MISRLTRVLPRGNLLWQGGTRFVSSNSSWRNWNDETRLWMKKNKVLFRGAIVKQRKGPHVPYVYDFSTHRWTISNVFGHLSFGFLALSYISSDALVLRSFAVGGVGCAILFQYYREKPLWLPLKWNALFLVINLGMILMLIDEANAAEHIPPEQKLVYEEVFKNRGLRPTEFVKLMRLAERREVKKGTVLVSSSKSSSHLYLLQLGRLTVRDESGKVIDELRPFQFAGALSYLQFDELRAARRKASSEAKQAFREQQSDWGPSAVSALSHWQEIVTVVKVPLLEPEPDKTSFTASGASTGRGLADVVAEEDVVVLAFSFDDISQLVAQSSNTNVSLSLERCLTVDLAKKMQNRQSRVSSK